MLYLEKENARSREKVKYYADEYLCERMCKWQQLIISVKLLKDKTTSLTDNSLGEIRKWNEQTFDDCTK